MIKYQHEPFTDFSLEENQQAYKEALMKVEDQLGEDYPLIIGGERITTEEKISSYNPAHKSQLIGRVSKANKELADVNFGEGVYDVNFSRAAADKDIEDIIFDLAKYENTWGQNNPEALLYIHDLNITRNDYQIMGKNQDTLKITKFGISYMKFHAKELIEELEKMDEIKINLIGKPNVNEWMNRQTPQMFIEAYELEDNKYGF